ncbi:hypothetical protein TGAM01_v200260 [Trichoderma gamsii]|uniref:WSC domain-containing protein n=1 Tax=Trichoderma gamsii TaxID=398673 RepID=A0A2P5A2R7_9HYPO|nr:hypothetical protein TGAM01_v200260 [Trichoderma gamsii]PON30840.1 hypothetical protein TGAM01_v200260 [Trichoderma gamsii]
MSRFALFAGLMAASVAAQAEFTAPGFRYIGCVEAEPPVFDFKADVPAPFSVQQCQYACHAKGKYAAMDGSCNCYYSSPSKAEPAYKIIDGYICSVPCIGGNTTAGMCGGPQCPMTGKKRYSLYKKEIDHHDDDDCEEEKTKSKDIGVWTKYISTTVATITACPPEVTDCPLSSTKATPHCPGQGCNVPTTSAEPTSPPCPEICGPPCSSEGCPICPPGCPIWTPVSHPTQTPPVPACDGEHCKLGPPPATLACPSGGCFHPHPTIIVSKGTRYQSGVSITVAALVGAVSWL